MEEPKPINLIKRKSTWVATRYEYSEVTGKMLTGEGPSKSQAIKNLEEAEMSARISTPKNHV